MKYLRNFPDAKTRDKVLSNIAYNVLSYTHGEGVLITNNNITIKIFKGYKTPVAVYEYTFDPSTVLADVANTVFEDHPDISSNYTIYLGDFEFEDVTTPLDSFSTLSDLGVTNGSILSFCEDLV